MRFSQSTAPPGPWAPPPETMPLTGGDARATRALPPRRGRGLAASGVGGTAGAAATGAVPADLRAACASGRTSRSMLGIEPWTFKSASHLAAAVA